MSQGAIFSPSKQPFYLFGHRGYSAIAPENTLPAFQALLEHQIPGAELDVRLCRSGQVVVIHDDSLERTTGSPALVQESTLAQIRALDAGSWFGASFKDERIPLLDEIFDLLGDRAYYDIELKWPSRKTGVLEERVLERIRAHDLSGRCMVSSFNPFCIRAVRRLAPSLPAALIYARHTSVPLLLRHGEGRLLCKAALMKPEYHQVRAWTARLYKCVFKNDLIAWTVDEPETAARLIRSGVRGIISNNPGKMKALLKA